MSKPKINLFALPSQTAMLFWLIASTLLGAILLGSAGSGPIPLAWLPLAIIFLSLRGFLERPSRDIRKGCLVPIGANFSRLQATIENGARQIGLKRIPVVLISHNQDALHIMGSFRRWYIVCGLDEAQSMEDKLGDPKSSLPVQAKLLHELYHFKTGDYWQLGYLTELFKAAFGLMLWTMAFFVGWSFLLALAKTAVLQFSPDSMLTGLSPETQALLKPMITASFPSPAELESMRQKAAGIDLFSVASFVVNISLPLIVLAAVLWWFYRASLWRMREFYADAGMAQTIGSAGPFLEIFDSDYFSDEDNRCPQKSRFTHFIKFIRKARNRISNLIGDHNFWPSFPERFNALASPQAVFYDWKKTAWLLGSLVLLLEIFLATPLTLPFTGENPIHFATLVIIMATTYFLLPHILLGKSGWVEGLFIIIAVNLIRTAWLLLTLALLWGLYFFQPGILFGVLQSAVYSTARYAGNGPFEIDLPGFLTKASAVNLLQVPIIIAIQAVSIFAMVFLLRRMCSWYAFFETSQRFRRAIFGLTLSMLFILLTIFLPLSSAVLAVNASVLMQPMAVVMAVLGILVGLGGGVWFYIQDRRYLHECPNCKTKVVVSNLLGATCPCCHKTLYPWLLANYEDA